MSEDEPRAVEIRPDQLDPETLRRVLEEFITREGTAYGLHEVDLDQKVDDVMRQITRREVRIVFDPDAETVNIVPTDSARRSGR